MVTIPYLIATFAPILLAVVPVTNASNLTIAKFGAAGAAVGIALDILLLIYGCPVRPYSA